MTLASGLTGSHKLEHTPETASGLRPGLLVCVKAHLDSAPFDDPVVGIIDHLDGEHFIKLTSEKCLGHHPRWIPSTWVSKIDGGIAYLKVTEEEFQTEVLNDPPYEILNKKVG